MPHATGPQIHEVWNCRRGRREGAVLHSMDFPRVLSPRQITRNMIYKSLQREAEERRRGIFRQRRASLISERMQMMIDDWHRK